MEKKELIKVIKQRIKTKEIKQKSVRFFIDILV